MMFMIAYCFRVQCSAHGSDAARRTEQTRPEIEHRACKGGREAAPTSDYKQPLTELLPRCYDDS